MSNAGQSKAKLQERFDKLGSKLGWFGNQENAKSKKGPRVSEIPEALKDESPFNVTQHSFIKSNTPQNISEADETVAEGSFFQPVSTIKRRQTHAWNRSMALQDFTNKTPASIPTGKKSKAKVPKSSKALSRKMQEAVQYSSEEEYEPPTTKVKPKERKGKSGKKAAQPLSKISCIKGKENDDKTSKDRPESWTLDETHSSGTSVPPTRERPSRAAKVKANKKLHQAVKFSSEEEDLSDQNQSKASGNEKNSVSSDHSVSLSSLSALSQSSASQSSLLSRDGKRLKKSKYKKVAKLHSAVKFSSDDDVSDAPLTEDVIPDTQDMEEQVSDTQSTCTHIPDTQEFEPQIPDVQINETNIPDTQFAGTPIHDALGREGNIPDTQSSEALFPDTQMSQTHVPDSQNINTSNTEVPDQVIMDLELSVDRLNLEKTSVKSLSSLPATPANVSLVAGTQQSKLFKNKFFGTSSYTPDADKDKKYVEQAACEDSKFQIVVTDSEDSGGDDGGPPGESSQTLSGQDTSPGIEVPGETEGVVPDSRESSPIQQENRVCEMSSRIASQSLFDESTDSIGIIPSTHSMGAAAEEDSSKVHRRPDEKTAARAKGKITKTRTKVNKLLTAVDFSDSDEGSSVHNTDDSRTSSNMSTNISDSKAVNQSANMTVNAESVALLSERLQRILTTQPKEKHAKKQTVKKAKEGTKSVQAKSKISVKLSQVLFSSSDDDSFHSMGEKEVGRKSTDSSFSLAGHDILTSTKLSDYSQVPGRKSDVCTISDLDNVSAISLASVQKTPSNLPEVDKKSLLCPLSCRIKLEKLDFHKISVTHNESLNENSSTDDKDMKDDLEQQSKEPVTDRVSSMNVSLQCSLAPPVDGEGSGEESDATVDYSHHLDAEESDSWSDEPVKTKKMSLQISLSDNLETLANTNEGVSDVSIDNLTKGAVEVPCQNSEVEPHVQTMDCGDFSEVIEVQDMSLQVSFSSQVYGSQPLLSQDNSDTRAPLVSPQPHPADNTVINNDTAQSVESESPEQCNISIQASLSSQRSSSSDTDQTGSELEESRDMSHTELEEPPERCNISIQASLPSQTCDSPHSNQTGSELEETRDMSHMRVEESPEQCNISIQASLPSQICDSPDNIQTGSEVEESRDMSHTELEESPEQFNISIQASLPSQRVSSSDTNQTGFELEESRDMSYTELEESPERCNISIQASLPSQICDSPHSKQTSSQHEQSSGTNPFSSELEESPEKCNISIQASLPSQRSVSPVRNLADSPTEEYLETMETSQSGSELVESPEQCNTSMQASLPSQTSVSPDKSHTESDSPSTCDISLQASLPSQLILSPDSVRTGLDSPETHEISIQASLPSQMSLSTDTNRTESASPEICNISLQASLPALSEWYTGVTGLAHWAKHDVFSPEVSCSSPSDIKSPVINLDIQFTNVDGSAQVQSDVSFTPEASPSRGVSRNNISIQASVASGEEDSSVSRVVSDLNTSEARSTVSSKSEALYLSILISEDESPQTTSKTSPAERPTSQNGSFTSWRSKKTDTGLQDQRERLESSSSSSNDEFCSCGESFSDCSEQGEDVVGRSADDSDSDELPDLDGRKGGAADRFNTKAKKNPYISEDESSDDLEDFFQKMKKPEIADKPVEEKKESLENSIDEFIVNDDDISSEDDDEIFHVKADNEKLRTKTPKDRSVSTRKYIPSSDDSDDDLLDFKTPMVKPKRVTIGKTPVTQPRPIAKDFRTPKQPLIKPKSATVRPAPVHRTPISGIGSSSLGEKGRANSTGHEPLRYGFLASLSTELTDEHRRHSDALKFVSHFKKHRDELSNRLFQLYNSTIFQGKLPENMPLTWNSRLYKTAGFCAYKKDPKAPSGRAVRIELSVKVCDSAERVRDTLAHEMCHAMVWFSHGKNDGHGPYWKYWARQATLVHSDLPPISRLHTYQISTKYIYKCTKCGYQFGRHSKSLDTDRKVCGFCKAPFELLVNTKKGLAAPPQTPKTPNRFAMFVKENYGSVQKSAKGLKHKDIMGKLSEEFAAKNKIKN